MSICKLGDLLVEQKQTVGTRDGGGLPLLGVNNKEGIIRSNHSGSADLSRYKIVKKGWFAYNPMRINVGSIGWMSNSEITGIISPDYVVFSCNDRLDPEYFWHFLKSDNGQREICNCTTGSVRERLYFNSLAEISIRVPPLEEQRNHAAKLSQIKDHLRQIQSTIESQRTSEVPRLRQAILQLAVEGRLASQDPHDEPVDEFLRTNDEERLRRLRSGTVRTKTSTNSDTVKQSQYVIPDGWDLRPLIDICQFIDYRGKTPTRTRAGVRLITAKNVRMGSVQDEPVEYVTEKQYEEWMTRGFPENGDLLFVTEGHTMGFVGMLKLSFRFALAQRTINLHPFVRGFNEYLLYYLMSPRFQSDIVQNATGSAAMGIKASKLKQLLIAVPPLAEQKRIVSKVAELLSLCDALEESLTRAEAVSSNLVSVTVQQILRHAFV